MRTNVEIFSKWLEVLKALDKPRTYRELADTINVSYKTVLKLIEDLEKLGFLEKKLEPSNPPQYIIKRTKKGDCIAKCL